VARHTNTSRPAEDRLDHGHDGGHTPLQFGELGLDSLLLAQGVLQLLVGLGGLELGDLALILFCPETLALTDGTLSLTVWMVLAPGTGVPLRGAESGLGVHLPLARFRSSCSGVRLATPRDPRDVFLFFAEAAASPLSAVSTLCRLAPSSAFSCASDSDCRRSGSSPGPGSDGAPP
jgi:hypothetical protein